MKCLNRYFCRLAVVAIAAATLMFLPTAVQAGGKPLATVSGGGTAVFPDNHPFLPGTTTQFGIGAVISNDLVDNQCDMDLDSLGVGSYMVTNGEFKAATGNFMCALVGPDVNAPNPGVVITGHVTQGRVNGDGSVTLCGLATFVDFFEGEPNIFPGQPWAIHLVDGVPDSFVYYDGVTGPGGDFEEVTKGHIQIKVH